MMEDEMLSLNRKKQSELNIIFKKNKIDLILLILIMDILNH